MRGEETQNHRSKDDVSQRGIVVVVCKLWRKPGGVTNAMMLDTLRDDGVHNCLLLTRKKKVPQTSDQEGLQVQLLITANANNRHEKSHC